VSVGNFDEVARARRGMIGILSAYAISESPQEFGITPERASRGSLGWALRLRSGQAPEGVCPYASGLNVQVLDVEGIVFDELAARFYVFAHERGKDGFSFGDVFELHG